MKKEIKENRDGTHTAIAGVRTKRCAAVQEAQAFLNTFLSRRHVDVVDNTNYRKKW